MYVGMMPFGGRASGVRAGNRGHQPYEARGFGKPCAVIFGHGGMIGL